MDNFRKSSYSNPYGSCIEVGNFRIASACNGGQCVEVGSSTQPSILIRDTKQKRLGDDERTMLQFSPDAWAEFTSQIKAGSTWG